MDFQRTPLYAELSAVQWLKPSHFLHLHHIPKKKRKKEEILTLIIAVSCTLFPALSETPLMAVTLQKDVINLLAS